MTILARLRSTVTIILILVTASIALMRPSTSVYTAATVGALTVTGVATNNDSVKIQFQPYPGAADYRVYDMSNPHRVKYAGEVHLQARSGHHYRVMAGTTTPVFPFVTDGNTGPNYTLGPNEFEHYTGPLPEIEWNGLEDHQPHTLVVQAVDQLGPFPPHNLYTTNGGGDISAANASAGMFGSDAGVTDDGNVSINGQGPSTNRPAVIAQSPPFVVRANPASLPLPSSPDATQVFMDTFSNAEASTIVQTGHVDTTHDLTYTLNAGTSHAWTIRFAGVNTTPGTTMPFIADSHFMNMTFDYAGILWSTMNMQPQPIADISDGKVLHMTEEVDAHTDNRRVLSFWLNPADDPITNYVEGQAPINTTRQALVVDVNMGACRVFLDTPNGAFPNQTQNEFINEGEQGTTGMGCPGNPSGWADQHNGRGLDDRSRIDLFVSTSYIALFMDGQEVAESAIPGGLGFTNVQTGFGEYFYHSFGDVDELNGACAGQWSWYTYCETDWLNNVPHSDERHWDNMGYEVLPSAAAPASGNWSSLAARIVMPTFQPPNLAIAGIATPATVSMPTNSPTPPNVTNIPTETPTPTLPTETPTPTLPTETPTPTLPTETPTLVSGATVFATGFESSDPQPTWNDTVDFRANVTGICCGLTHMESSLRYEIAHTGGAALMYSGLATSAQKAYSYNKVFDLRGRAITLSATATLSYWIYPQDGFAGAQGTNSTHVSIDMIFTDGSDLRDSGAVDQYGVRLHPQYQGDGGRLSINTWNYVKSIIGPYVAGKTIDRILVAYDQPNKTGAYRGYIDDIQLSN